MIDLKNSEGVFCMTNAQFESEKEYQVRMNLIKEMLKLGLLTENGLIPGFLRGNML